MSAVPFSLDARAFEGLLRIIEYLLPTGGPYPPVRNVVRREDASVSVGAVPKGDRKALVFILQVFRWIPGWAIGLPLNMLRWAGKVPGGVGAPFRLLTLGFDGLAFTLYFSAPAALSVLRWDAKLPWQGEISK